jgi:EthD domain
MNQVVLLQCPLRLTRQQWLQIWQHSHTPVAIETQSSFGYRQNIVMHPVSEPLVLCDAIVEENFPAEAMTDREAFYGAAGNPTLKAEREKRMIDSCTRFIDFDRIDCIPTSEYLR